MKNDAPKAEVSRLCANRLSLHSRRVRRLRFPSVFPVSERRERDVLAAGVFDEEAVLTNRELLVEPQSYSILNHVQMIEAGDYGLPEFQRTFVWDEERVRLFWESLHRGFPVGQLMFWEPENQADFPMRSFGRNQADLAAGRRYAAIDGQQRLTAVWLVLKGDIPLRFDLDRGQFTYRDTPKSVRLDILARRNTADAMSRNFFFVSASGDQQESFAGSLHNLNATLTGRKIPSQTIRHADYPTVVRIFDRINTQGIPLSEAQIALASISTKWPGVFRRTFEELKKLNDEVGFDRIEDPNFIVQAWTAVHTGQHLIKHLAPQAEDSAGSRYVSMATAELFEQSWSRLQRGIEGLIRLMRDELHIDNFQFIKQYAPLIPVINFLAHRENPVEQDKNSLTKWLLMAFAQSRYSVRSQTKLREDIKATGPQGGLTSLFTHRWEALDPTRFAITEEELLKEVFNSGYSTLLYIVMRGRNAVDWLTPEIRVGDKLGDDGRDAWEFHHIFPNATFAGERADLRNRKESAEQEQDEASVKSLEDERVRLESRVRSIGNLAFLTPSSNQSIGERPPSEYLAEICKQPGGEDRLARQFVPLDRNLWMHKNFEEFCRERCRLIVRAAKESLGL